MVPNSRRGALVGRASELATLDAILDALVDLEVAPILQVAGDAGIGKSRLLSELSSAAQDRGYLVLTGPGREVESELPFGVVGDALDDWLTP